MIKFCLCQGIQKTVVVRVVDTLTKLLQNMQYSGLTAIV